MNLRVKDICREQGITMEKLAGILEITPNTLTRNINGNPTIETLEKIASALNVNIVDLFEEQRQNNSELNCPNCGAELEIRKKE